MTAAKPRPSARGGATCLRVDRSDGRVVDVGEGQVAVVAIEPVPGRADEVGRAIQADPPRLELAAEDVVLGQLPDAVLGDVEVEVAVVVVVEPGPARGPSGSVDPGRGADVAEGAVAVIEVQGVAAVVAEEDVGIAVVVDVRRRRCRGRIPRSQGRRTRSRPGIFRPRGCGRGDWDPCGRSRAAGASPWRSRGRGGRRRRSRTSPRPSRSPWGNASRRSCRRRGRSRCPTAAAMSVNRNGLDSACGESAAGAAPASPCRSPTIRDAAGTAAAAAAPFAGASPDDRRPVEVGSQPATAARSPATIPQRRATATRPSLMRSPSAATTPGSASRDCTPGIVGRRRDRRGVSAWTFDLGCRPGAGAGGSRSSPRRARSFQASYPLPAGLSGS